MSLCFRCQQRPATRQVTDPGGAVSLLCDLCATTQLVPVALILPMLGGPVAPEGIACPACGSSLQRLSQSSRMGCSHCYLHFRPQVLASLRRLHGSTTHTGRRPIPRLEALPPARREALRTLLMQAIAEERFEDAAALRDQIRALND